MRPKVYTVTLNVSGPGVNDIDTKAGYIPLWSKSTTCRW